MHNKYIKLFEELARATAVSAEQVMDYDKQKGDDKGFEAAQVMRDNFEELKDRIIQADDDYKMNKSDAAKLTVGTLIIVNQLQDRIESLKKALTGYQTDVLPKLQAVVDESKNDEEAQAKAEEKFSIIEEK